MFYETIIKNVADIQKVSRYARYFSTTTGLVVISEEYKDCVPSKYPLKEFVEGGKSLPTPTTPGNRYTVVFDESPNFRVLNQDIELVAYFNKYKSFDTLIYPSLYKEFYYLLKNDLITQGDGKSIKEIFFRLGQSSTIGDLVMSDHGVGKTRKKFTEAQKELSAVKVFSDAISEVADDITTDRFRVLDTMISKNNHGASYKNVSFLLEKTGEVINYNFYTKLNPAVESTLTRDSYVNIAYSEDDNGKFNFYCFAPTEDFKLDKSWKVSPSKEAKKLLKGVPVELFRRAFYEYKIRTELYARF